MTTRREEILRECLEISVRPLVRFCLRRSLGLHHLVEALKAVFVQCATDEIKRNGGKITLRRISVMTGVHRRDVTRLGKNDQKKTDTSNFPVRIITRWRQDQRFLSTSGKPRVLSYKGADSEFTKLVRSESSEIKPGTVLFDLERVGAVQRTAMGLKLIARAYISKGDWIEGFHMLARDTQDLMDAIVDNLEVEEEKRYNFHAHTVFDNISISELPKIQNWFLRSCSAFHRRAEKYLSRYDLDINPDKTKKGGARFAYGSFTRSKSPEK